MRYLNQFVSFDCKRFFEGKDLVVCETAPWNERDTNRLLGTVVTVVIMADQTPYDGKPGNNRFEKLKLKVGKQVSVNPEQHVVPVNAVGKVWGDYNGNLAIVCDDVKVVAPSKAGN